MIANTLRSGQDSADNFRKLHGLGFSLIVDLVTTIEETTEAAVAIVDAPVDQHGLTMNDPASGKVVIAVARTQHPMRQRSSLAHELAHVVFADWQISYDGDFLLGARGKTRRLLCTKYPRP